MSQATSTAATWSRTISQQIGALRRQLKSAVWVRGLGRVVAALVGLVLLDLLLDRALRFDVSQRAVMLALLALAMVYLINRWLVKPLSAVASDDALALELQRAGGVPRDAVISAWQFARSENWERSGVSASLVEATMKLGGEAAAQIQVTSLLDRPRLRTDWSLMIASLLAVAGIVAAVTSTDLGRTWLDRNLLLGSSRWPQETYLIVQGLDEDGRLPVVRGEDHKLIVTIDPNSRRKDVEVSLDYRDEGGRYRQKLRRFEENGEIRFEHTFGTVVSEFSFQAFGGDARTDWIQVRLVEPPGIESLEMVAQAPAYTGLPPEVLERGRSPYDLLKGSSLKLSGTANKPLSKAILKGPEADFEFQISGETSLLLELNSGSLVEGKYVFDLVDTQGLTTRHPASFTLRLIEDRAPRVRAATYGIGGLVVPIARIPLRIGIDDEFAAVDATLRHSWKGDQPDSVAQSGELALTEVQSLLPAAKTEATTVWELESLKIPEGASLVFSVAVHDNRQPEANLGESKTFLLRVVSEAELRTDLLRREREQRELLERQRSEQQDLITDLRAAMAEARLKLSGGEAGTIDPVDTILEVRRRQRAIGAVVIQVSDAFEAMLIEAENNRLDEESGRLRTRLADQIIAPLRALDAQEIETSDQQLEAARLASEATDLPDRIAAAIQTQEAIIVKIDQILTAMVKAEGYQEAINLLREIERTQQRVLEMTDEERKRRIQNIFEGNEDR